MTRPIPLILRQLFDAARKQPSDINEHLDTLYALASECEHVTEFGMRGANGSTIALLAAQPETFISWDIDPWSVVAQPVANLIAANIDGRTKFQPRVGDTLKIAPIEETDMLFIDTLHTCDQLLAELVRHVDPGLESRDGIRKVRKYMAFHDTVTFGLKGEDGSEPGLLAALRHFQKNHAFPLWHLKEDRKNNNGLIILEHV